MGWMGTPHHGNPNTEDLNRIIDDAMVSDSYDIIDRSGWMGWDHQYLLCELREDALPDQPCRRFITMALIRQTAGEVAYKLISEADGPAERDCPKRILDAADKYAASADRATQWRAECRQYHADRREFNRALKRVEDREENADKRILMHDGRIVTYAPVRYGNRTARAYRNDGDPQLWRLNMKAVDIEGTLALRQAHKTAVEQAA